jgi:hypothetical protein
MFVLLSKRENDMRKLINELKFLFLKKHSIEQLCDYYVDPQEVRDYLQLLADRNRLLAISLKDDIRNLNQIIDEDYRLQQQGYEEYLLEKQINSGGCIDCPFGNGEGECTILSCDCDFL